MANVGRIQFPVWTKLHAFKQKTHFCGPLRGKTRSFLEKVGFIYESASAGAFIRRGNCVLTLIEQWPPSDSWRAKELFRPANWLRKNLVRSISRKASRIDWIHRLTMKETLLWVNGEASNQAVTLLREAGCFNSNNIITPGTTLCSAMLRFQSTVWTSCPPCLYPPPPPNPRTLGLISSLHSMYVS